MAAAALWGLVAVVRRLRQAAGQRTATAVTERARQGAIAEGDDAALEHADGAVVPPAVAEGESDPDAKVLDQPVQFLAGRGVGADGLDPVRERDRFLDLHLDARGRLAVRHPFLDFGERLLGFS
ncbi:MAG: hypothetical protein LW698_16665 [Planctomycetaceae bacterium]|nr:hypothetical protein [Planctomycetaceae bacterium]